jgi:hypothetical protein
MYMRYRIQSGRAIVDAIVLPAGYRIPPSARVQTSGSMERPGAADTSANIQLDARAVDTALGGRFKLDTSNM